MRVLRFVWMGIVAVALAATTVAVVPAPSASAAPGDAPVTGAIYVDFDRDGRIDPGEGVSDSDPLAPPNGVTVTAYDADGGSEACTVTPGAPPSFSCDVTGLTGSEFRVEFTLDASDETAGWSSAPGGSDYGTSVQFAGAGDTADWAVVPPSQCPTTGAGFGGNPNSADGKIWTTCFVNGGRDSGGPQDVLVGLNYDSTGAVEKIGLKGDTQGTTSAPNELGGVWGIAYDEWRSTIYTSALLRRHIDLGSAGLDGLYYMTYPSGTWSAVSLGSLPGAPSYGTVPVRDLSGVAFGDPSYDAQTYSQVGRVGIGDIDVTADGRTLLVSNLSTKSIDVYDISGAGGAPLYVRSVAITNPGCSDSASTDDYQVWAIKALDADSAYAGVTCTAENSGDSADLEAHVIPVDIAAGAVGASLLTIPLDYARACGGYDTCVAGGRNGLFQPWSDPFPVPLEGNKIHNPQPVFSDLDVAPDGSLTLGFLDRAGLQFGANNFLPDPTETDPTLIEIFAEGETLRACNVGTEIAPSWVLEGPAGSACDTFAASSAVDAVPGDGSSVTDNLGPGGSAEWFGGDVFGGGIAGHGEITSGGVFTHPYRDESLVSMYDPLRGNTGGLRWYDNQTGGTLNSFELYAGVTAEGFSGKAGGIGDVEGCFIPIEIGNFVWLDLDGDGVQDPGETPLAGVTVTLTDAGGNVIATTTTDANGEYYFDSADGVEANSTYTIGFDVTTNTSPLPGGFTNADLAETIPDSVASTDAADSDVIGGEIAASTGNPGLNDHSFDAGYVLPFDLALQKQVSNGSNLAAASPGATVTFTITLHNQGGQIGRDIEVTDYLPASGLTLADSDWTDQNDGTATLTHPGPLNPGSTATVDISFTVDADASGQIDNWAEISSADNDGDPNTPPPTDVDSTPDTDQADDSQPSGPNDTTDDEVDEDGLNGGDEDDHDVAGVTITPAFSLGNQVWIDTNNNGLIDSGETPIEGVWVELFTDTDGDGQPDDLNNDGVIDVNDAVATTGTDANGMYLFDGLLPGDYIVGIPPMEWDDGAPLEGMISSGPTSTNPDDDVDNDDNGMTGPDGYIVSGPVTLGDGEPTGENPDNDPNTPDGNENLTVDFGFYEPIFDLALRKQLKDGSNSSSVSPGDEVTFTITIVNQGTLAAANMTIVDYVPTGLTLKDADWTAQTDGSATIEVAGPIAPGASTTVDITFTVNADATGTIDNWAEIAAATPVDADGNQVLGVDGEPIADIDSIPDAANTDLFETDDAVDGDGRNGGEEDDHDRAQLVLREPEPETSQPALALTGSMWPAAFLFWSIGLIFIGAAFVVLGRKEKDLYLESYDQFR